MVVLSFKINIFKVSKGAKIRNRYNQVPHLTQDTNGKVTNSQLDTTNESQEVSLSQQVTKRHTQRHSKHKTEKNMKDPQKKNRLGTVKKYFRNTSLSEFQTIWTQIRPDVLLGLIWVQKVCKLLYAVNSQRVNTNIKRYIKAAFLLISKCINNIYLLLQGDWGGPLGCYAANGDFTQVGVFSYSPMMTCSATPQVFTRVSKYRAWIESNTVATA